MGIEQENALQLRDRTLTETYETDRNDKTDRIPPQYEKTERIRLLLIKTTIQYISTFID